MVLNRDYGFVKAAVKNGHDFPKVDAQKSTTEAVNTA